MIAFRLREIPGPDSGLPAVDRTVAVLAVLVGVCTITLDIAIANTALPAIARAFGVTDAQSIWVVSSFQLAMVASVLPATSLGEVFGLRRVAVFGLLVFSSASMFCGFAPSFQWLLVFRLAQGIGASGMLGVGVVIMRFIFPKSLLGRGMGLNALIVAVAFAAGPSATSAVLSVLDWQWLFLLNAPIASAAAALGLYAFPATPRNTRGFDVVGAFLAAIFLASAVYAFSSGAQNGSPVVTASFAAIALVFLFILIRWQDGHVTPVLAVDLLRAPVFALSLAVSLATFFSQSLAFVSMPFLFQTGFGFSQIETGYLLTTWPLFSAVATLISGRLSDQVPVSLICAIGLILMGSGMILTATAPHPATALDIVWRLAICGVGFGLFQPPNMRAIVLATPPERSGGAGGASSVVVSLGQALAAAAVAALFNLLSDGGAVAPLWVGAAVALCGCCISLMRLAYPSDE